MLPFATACLFGGKRAPLVQDFNGGSGALLAPQLVTAPSGAQTLTIECVGAGGGHGATDDGSTYTGWWGGAGGGYSRKVVLPQNVYVRPINSAGGDSSWVKTSGGSIICRAFSGYTDGSQSLGGAGYSGDVNYEGGPGSLPGGGSGGPGGAGATPSSGWPSPQGEGGTGPVDPNGKFPGGGCAVWWDPGLGPVWGTNAAGLVRLTWTF